MTLATPERLDEVLSANPAFADAEAKVDATIDILDSIGSDEKSAVLEASLTAAATALMTAEVSEDERIGLVARAIHDALFVSDEAEEFEAYTRGYLSGRSDENDRACRAILALVNKFPGQSVTLSEADRDFVVSGQYELGAKAGDGPFDLTYYVTVPHTEDADPALD